MGRQALKSIAANRTRTVLMMLGVIIGVATLTVIASSVLGARAEVLARVEKFGLQQVGIIAGAGRKPGVPQPVCTSLKVEDAQAMLSEIPNVKSVCSEIVRTDFPVKHGNRSTYAAIIAADPSWASMWGIGLDKGRFLSQEDNIHLARVGVIGKTIQRDLYEHEDPIGKRILINNNPFTIVGVLETRGTTPHGDDMDNQIIIPVSTGQKRVFHQDYVFAIKVELKNSSNMSRSVNDIRELLRERHNLGQGVENDFTIITPTLIMNMMASLSATFSLFLMLVSGISLIVGAIVIANIMFMSVHDRRKEIGLRRSVGARKRDILLQFLLEAVCVAATGGIFGIILGLVGLKVLSGYMKVPATIMWQPIVLGLVSAIAVGLIAGIQPARKAANAHPVEVLR
ncbi:ABC transporter permease [Desulfomonile tiedjei]|uniref:ABC-type antimicrobial peptide transport system, permease component n=1 Tax=Desulfomonile tiedjei (strain ATCC 49306 / DSM 6799 / DCB-1) TaxID=706587 RepID=I4C9E7_DESTA|nr:ABC transporter permease [Desulfomonile tiedjei]AFM26188.1 ABC-type antimicrobial peptide transport system, permease component [Desulfomonile tiedjei DSM 6799]